MCILINVPPSMERVCYQVERLFATAKRQFGYPITTVVNNARIDFSFDSDVHPKISSLTWEAFEDQLRGCLQGVFNTTKGFFALPFCLINMHELIKLNSSASRNARVCFRKDYKCSIYSRSKSGRAQP